MSTGALSARSTAAATRKLGSVLAFAVAPVAALVLMLVIGLGGPGPLAHDFHYELYPEAKALLDGESPFPGGAFDPLSPEPNLIWPPIAAFLVSPLTLLPIGTADVVMAGLGLACFAAALWVVGVRDWRVYGAFALWPQVAGEMRVSHLTPVVALLVALAWRHRDSQLRAGAACGLAISLKLSVWPLAVWLAAGRRHRAFSRCSRNRALSLLLLLPFTSLDSYVRALTELGRTFDQDSYTVFGLLAQLGAPDAVARGATLLLGAALLAGVWTRRSFALAVGASLVLSPIVWLDYFAILGVPLAIARPRLSVVWLVPLATWGAQGSGIGIGDSVRHRTCPRVLRMRARDRRPRRTACGGRVRRPKRDRMRRLTSAFARASEETRNRLVLGLAALVATVSVIEQVIDEKVGLTPDSPGFLEAARGILDGNPFDVKRTPGYPALLALAGANVTAAALLQAVLFVGCAVGVGFLAQRATGRWWAGATGALFGLMELPLDYSRNVTSELLAMTLVVAVGCLAAVFRRAGCGRRPRSSRCSCSPDRSSSRCRPCFSCSSHSPIATAEQGFTRFSRRPRSTRWPASTCSATTRSTVTAGLPRSRGSTALARSCSTPCRTRRQTLRGDDYTNRRTPPGGPRGESVPPTEDVSARRGRPLATRGRLRPGGLRAAPLEYGWKTAELAGRQKKLLALSALGFLVWALVRTRGARLVGFLSLVCLYDVVMVSLGAYDNYERLYAPVFPLTIVLIVSIAILDVELVRRLAAGARRLRPRRRQPR